MKYISIKFRNRQWDAQISSDRYSIMFVAVIAKSKGLEKSFIELRGKNFVTKEIHSWIDLEDIQAEEEVQIELCEEEKSRNKNSQPEEEQSQIVQQLSTDRPSPNYFIVSFNDQMVEGVIKPDANDTMFLLSVKVFDKDEQIEALLFGNAAHNQDDEGSISLDIGDARHFTLRFKHK
ncbi:MAG: hypothetical protein NXH89_02775 [Cyclobacteriaceae bacterium]|nr:hypothetical protein [Cyclobacteriaceae bacterium]